MSIIVAIKRKNEIVIGADTQNSLGSMKLTAKHVVNSSKIISLKKDTYMGFAGWNSPIQAFSHLVLQREKKAKKRDRFDFSTQDSIFESLLKIQPILTKEYFVSDYESRNVPADSNQINAIIINKNGIFEIDTLREVTEFRDYWAIGSGQEYALGVFHALYDSDMPLVQIAKKAIEASCEFDDGCSLPADIYSLRI